MQKPPYNSWQTIPNNQLEQLQRLQVQKQHLHISRPWTSQSSPPPRFSATWLDLTRFNSLSSLNFFVVVAWRKILAKFKPFARTVKATRPWSGQSTESPSRRSIKSYELLLSILPFIDIFFTSTAAMKSVDFVRFAYENDFFLVFLPFYKFYKFFPVSARLAT